MVCCMNNGFGVVFWVFGWVSIDKDVDDFISDFFIIDERLLLVYDIRVNSLIYL